MDKSLDEIIAAKPKGGRRGGAGAGGDRRRSTGRAQILGKPAPAPIHKTRAAVAQAPKVAGTPSSTADKIIVSNLPPDVNEVQVKELFTTTVGPLRDATLHYDASGRSKGVAAVHFSRKGDGNKAYNLYNNKLIDGKRPMKIEIVLDPIRAVPLASRVAAAPAVVAAPANGAPRNGPVRRRRGRGGAAGGAGGAKRGERPQKSVADLDAEMEDYTASASAPAAAPAAAV